MNSATSKIVSIILVICVGTSLFTIVFHMLNQKYETETAVLSAADDSLVFKGVYIRDEEIVKYGGTGIVSYCLSDGSKLGTGSAIAEIYADEAQIDIKEKIEKLNSEAAILEKITNPGTLESAQPASIAGLINEKYKSVIYSREKADLDELAEQKNELLVLLSTYQLVTDAGIDLKGRIAAINAEIAQLKAAETVPLDTIIAAHSAYFVSYADGYEEKLKPSELNNINADLINSVKDSGPVSENVVIGKLINSYEWYIAGVVDGGKLNFGRDDDVRIKLQSTSDTLSGTVHDIRETDNPEKKIVIIKCDEITYDLVQHRCERVEIVDEELKGIKVPKKALRFQKMEDTVYDEKTGEEVTKVVNCKGVYVKLGERLSFKRVDVIYEGDDYILSSASAGSGYLALYDDIVVEGVDDNGG